MKKEKSLLQGIEIESLFPDTLGCLTWFQGSCEPPEIKYKSLHMQFFFKGEGHSLYQILKDEAEGIYGLRWLRMAEVLFTVLFGVLSWTSL